MKESVKHYGSFETMSNHPVRLVPNRTGLKPGWFGSTIQFYHQNDRNRAEPGSLALLHAEPSDSAQFKIFFYIGGRDEKRRPKTSPLSISTMKKREIYKKRGEIID